MNKLKQLAVAALLAIATPQIALAEEDKKLIPGDLSFTATLALERTVAEVAETTCAELRAAFRAQRAAFAVLGDGDEHIVVVRADGFDRTSMDGWRKLPLDSPVPLAEAVRLAEPLYFENGAALDARYPEQMGTRTPGDGAAVVLPLVADRRALGSIELIYDRPRRFSEDDRRELIALARVCAQAVDRAYLFDVAQLERRRAEEANRAKDEFLAVVSHELRTPLNAILGWAKMLNAGALSDEQTRKATATIERNALAQAQLIDDLLDVSRIITGQMRIKGEPVDLRSGEAMGGRGVEIPLIGREQDSGRGLEQVGEPQQGGVLPLRRHRGEREGGGAGALRDRGDEMGEVGGHGKIAPRVAESVRRAK